MKKNKNWDTLAWIIIWIFILSFSLLWIMNILNFNRDTYESYDESINNYILKANSKNILSKLDLSKLNNNENFYIYRDDISKEFKILTWSVNKSYAYIDYLWNKVDPSKNLWKTYKSIFTKKSDILKHIIKPSEIKNIAFQFDANNIDWMNNSTLNDGDEITKWKDISGNNNDWHNWTWNSPKYIVNWINSFPYVKFDWDNDMLKIDNNPLINEWDWEITYPEKSFAIVLKTWFDVQSPQTVYEEWWDNRWYSFVIHNRNIFAWIWNNQERDSWNQYKSVNLWEALPDSVYFIMIVQDSTHWNDNDNKLKIYLNWKLANEQNHVDIQTEHSDYIGIWAINNKTVRASDNKAISWWWDFFKKWWIWELISWDHALSDTEIKWIQNYFKEKWLGWKSNIIYNIVNSDIKKYNQ